MSTYYANEYVAIATAASEGKAILFLRGRDMNYLPVMMKFCDPENGVEYDIDVRCHFEYTEKHPGPLGQLALRG